MLKLNSIMLGSENAKALAEFYEKVLEKKPDMEEEGWYGWNTGSCFFAIGDHSEVKGSSKNPERILYTFETAEVQKEFDRLVKEGAKAVKEPYEMGEGFIATLADPEGNFFQLMTPWKE
ncbi:MAG: VOC family protein [Microgenomates group bacterium]|jgi:predicted enzyme related to lactoylglutathione lyase|nr:hypothetical protein [Candidatus Woesebacteria bacterium]MBP6883066.1 hypothetical protein [Candidatus Woesebacteria bacterium]QQR63857.1 MAG: hypothetical protein IPH70_05155 [Candidatus Roizmanbacteria bacterium]